MTTHESSEDTWDRDRAITGMLSAAYDLLQTCLAIAGRDPVVDAIYEAKLAINKATGLVGTRGPVLSNTEGSK